MTCPSVEQLLAFGGHELAAEPRLAIEAHIDECCDCRSVVSSLVRGSVAEPELGRYRIETVIGSGGMGIVYRAFDPLLRRRIAIKVVNTEGSDESLRARLVLEAQSLARLSHPNVCQVYDVCRVHDDVWVAMELIAGIDLRLWAATRPVREIESALRDAARGLAAAHAAGLIHRDVKPENVLVTLHGRVVVTDFGLARSTSSSTSSLSAHGVVPGTPGYLAPEQLTGSPLDARVDQFAWAVMAWELLAGERPFPIEPAARLTAIRAGVSRARALSPRMGDALARALSIAPRDRFESMDALLSALSEIAVVRRRRRVSAAAFAAMIVVSALFIAMRTFAPGGIAAGAATHVADAGPGTRVALAAAPSSTDAGVAVPDPLRIGAMAAAPATPSVVSPPGAVGPLAPPPASAVVHRTPGAGRGVAPRAAVLRPSPLARGAAAPGPEPADPYLTMPTESVGATPGKPPDAPPASPGAGSAGALATTTTPSPPPSRLRPRFDRARAERILADCRFPVDPANPERALMGLGSVVDWGLVTRREPVWSAESERMMMYEVEGSRERYRFDGAGLPQVGVLDAAVGDLVVVCPFTRAATSGSKGPLLPPAWRVPSRPIYAFAPASVVPRIATDLRALAPLHVPESVLRDMAVDIPRELASRTLLVWAKPTTTSGPSWEMNGWTMEAGDLSGAASVVAGRPSWFVVDRPRVGGSPANLRPILHGVRALPSLLR
jgi:hypothetical protein